MIEVSDLKKVFGEFEAIRGISFSIERGEVVGFLGPNGAGKSTTMRILTGFIPASSGSAIVAGYDVFEDSLEVRKRLGYLPENVPLYPEMRVEEYLRYRAALKKIPSFERQANIDKAMEQCWLTDSRRRIIGHLSKGFRQRVGLADALLGSPDVLILDEPTVGLDPNQVRDTRKLIKSLAENHTVILSTHILHEVEIICSRVIIINEGLIVADDSQEGLVESMSDTSKLFVEVIGTDPRPIEEELESNPGIDKYYLVSSEDLIKIEIEQKAGFDLRTELSSRLSQFGYAIKEFRSDRYRLEDIFSYLTSDKYVDIGDVSDEEGEDVAVDGEELVDGEVPIVQEVDGEIPQQDETEVSEVEDQTSQAVDTQESVPEPQEEELVVKGDDSVSEADQDSLPSEVLPPAEEAVDDAEDSEKKETEGGSK